MKRNNILLPAISFSAAILFLTTSHVFAAGPSKAEILAHSCLTCHGPNGAGSGKIPELKGLKKSDITESLFGFASGDEKSTMMGHHAKAFTDEEINMLAEYFAALDK